MSDRLSGRCSLTLDDDFSSQARRVLFITGSSRFVHHRLVTFCSSQARHVLFLTGSSRPPGSGHPQRGSLPVPALDDTRDGPPGAAEVQQQDRVHVHLPGPRLRRHGRHPSPALLHHHLLHDRHLRQPRQVAQTSVTAQGESCCSCCSCCCCLTAAWRR